VINNAYDLIRAQIKICGNFPQNYPDRHNMKKISSDPPDLGGSQKNIPIHLIWDRSEEIFCLITSCAARILMKAVHSGCLLEFNFLKIYE